MMIMGVSIGSAVFKKTPFGGHCLKGLYLTAGASCRCPGPEALHVSLTPDTGENY